MTTKDVLIAAKAKVAQGWTQGQYARTTDGIAVPWYDEAAVCWCLIGALGAVSHATNWVAREALGVAADVPSYELHVWNDAEDRTQADVLAAFDKAIALVEEE